MPDLSTVPPGQSPQGTPLPVQQAPVEPNPAPQPVIITGNEPPAPPAPPQPPADAPTAEQIAQLQQQAAQAQQYQQALQQREEQYRNLQAAYTRGQQALATLGATPPPPPQDPIAPYVQKLVAQGYGEKDARAVAQTQYEMTQQFLAPIQTQVQQYQAAAMAQQTVEPVMQQLYQQRPDLFQVPGVYEQTKQGLIAQAAHNGKVDVVQAAMTAAALSMQASFQQPPQGQQFPPMAPQYQPQPQFQPGQQIPQPFANGQFRVMPNFQQQPVQPTVLPADSQMVSDDMRSYFKLPTKTA